MLNSQEKHASYESYDRLKSEKSHFSNTGKSFQQEFSVGYKYP